MRIALVEDDPAQAQLIGSWLGDAGHSVVAFDSGAPFRRALHHESYDLAILDWDLPDTTGIEILSAIRAQHGWSMPVLFITVRDREEDVVCALDAGADDYLSKPVSRSVLLSRLGALGRRGQPLVVSPVLDAPPFVFNPDSNSLTRFDEDIVLTEMEFQLALYLFRNVGRLLSRAHLLAEVWGVRAELTTRTVDTHMSKLRRKLGISSDVGWRLRAVYQHGYRLERLTNS